jgi:group I intron endonuclease
MSTIYSIYKCTNLINNKIYIGFTSHWPKRMHAHLAESFNKNCKNYKHHFHKAIRKWGQENFEWEIIYQSKDYDYCIKTMEPYFIKEYNSFGRNGYNETLGGEGTIGFIPKHMMGENNPMKKEIVRKKVSKTLAGRKSKVVYTKELRQKLSNAKKGKFNPNYGKSTIHINLNQKSTCNICGITTNLGNIKRWHNANCKLVK